MANIKSQKKRIEIAEDRRQKNAAFKSQMRHAVKKVDIAVQAGDLENAEALLPNAISLLDKSVKENIQHLNTASRQKARIMNEVQALEKAPKKDVSEAAKKAEEKEILKEEAAEKAEAKEAK